MLKNLDFFLNFVKVFRLRKAFEMCADRDIRAVLNFILLLNELKHRLQHKISELCALVSMSFIRCLDEYISLTTANFTFYFMFY